jgi:hypothetical protein
LNVNKKFIVVAISMVYTLNGHDDLKLIGTAYGDETKKFDTAIPVMVMELFIKIITRAIDFL